MSRPSIQPECCLTPNCTNQPLVRGLCAPCYHVAWELVDAELTTWERLEAERKCLTPQKRRSAASGVREHMLKRTAS